MRHADEIGPRTLGGAIGGTLACNFDVGGTAVSTRVTVYREFDVTNRLEGTAGYFTVALPLMVMK